ncbi:ABC transporter ATP-binding protein [Paraburkholderia sp. BCC1886]|uniref:ABC transporter ATP-binding protein n=1 Tax=Paraburkholderia sp. BCC1886 TaxID=2562670 RepID=UPI001183B4FE|nr:ABC transporter ATP-binding protein [Paraburkholderia sp. BCC1886]
MIKLVSTNPAAEVAPLLAIRNLSIALPAKADRAHAVEALSFDVRGGEIVCLVGESGSGKSMTAHAVLGLLPRGVTIAAGSSIKLGGEELAQLHGERMRALRGSKIAMIFQDPMSALNPLQTIGQQLAEAIVLHDDGKSGRREIQERCLAMIASVGLPAPDHIMRSFPFQLSGGQRQRVMIAIALVNRPQLLIADEPTTALDVTTQRQILDLIRELQLERQMGVLFITHDFGVVADIANRVIVMRHGRLVEAGERDQVLRAPRDAYTQRLVDAVPGRDVPTRGAAALDRATTGRAPMLEVRALRKTFVSRNGFFGKPRVVPAADDIAFDVYQGETVSVVGESGSGKTTLGRMIMRLIEPDSGSIRLDGQDLLTLSRRDLQSYRRRAQIVFQDPFASLNPRQTIGEAIVRGPILAGTPRKQAVTLATELLERVGIGATALARYPHEFSGGQRQRIAIARALAVKPSLLIADEAVSALDVSVQAQVLALLDELKRELGLTMLFITHDLRVAAQISDRVVVLQRGKVVEQSSAVQIFSAPSHAYTRSLLDAMPGRDWLVAPHTGTDYELPRTVG